MKKHFPNIITLINLFFGCFAILMILTGQFTMGIWFVGLAALADFADGLVARLLKVQTNVGKELDSLADMVSFGLVPGLILFILFQIGFHGNENMFNQSMSTFGIKLMDAPYLYGFMGFLVTLFSAFRLAKFNLDTRQSENFIGMPTPAATILVIGFLLVYQYNAFGLGQLMINPVFLGICSVGISLLLVSEIPMFSLKFKKMKWDGNEIRILFFLSAILIFILFKAGGIALIMMTYLTFAIISNFTKKQI